ncbi:MAG: protein-(glutamine-N5) methyltransferase release factor-specific [bacterium]|nr:MAG: protein-(glutamine-N5) methyltransferase release factor-specific [bacterium]KAF0148015.1 MAG: protein-(glutamine-N5) methyltransferase release factor-specific [bacterium]KAF0164891.1 MAG: protein-(glutamine-N5) methyltransferase release factor-specific [bacterium]
MRREADVLPSPPGGGAGGEGRPGTAPRVADLMREAAARLQAALGLERREARLEAQILIARGLGVERSWLIAHDRDTLSPAQTVAIEALLARRAGGEPVAYILGEREFYGRVFRVTPDVLIPRPETELLVEAALDRLPPERPARVLDLGTGSGCIAISLALERPRAEVSALDASAQALAVARDNARRLGADQITWILSDWYADLSVKNFDMIVGNPPYITSGNEHLRRGDLLGEPVGALVSGYDGLDAIRAIIVGAPARLVQGGWLLIEHGFDQKDSCQTLLRQAGFTRVTALTDLSGVERLSIGRFSGLGAEP